MVLFVDNTLNFGILNYIESYYSLNMAINTFMGLAFLNSIAQEKTLGYGIQASLDNLMMNRSMID